MFKFYLSRCTKLNSIYSHRSYILDICRVNLNSSPFMGKRGKKFHNIAVFGSGNSNSRNRSHLDDIYNDYLDSEYEDLIDVPGLVLSKGFQQKAPVKNSPIHSNNYQFGTKRSKTDSKWNGTMKPRNLNQEKYIKMLEHPLPYIVVASGGAGVGKTSIAVSVAVQQLLNHKYDKIVITRPMVTVEEEVGFLPGGLEEKMDPWMRPLYDTFYKYYTPDQVKAMIASKIIDICPIAFLRGRTLENSFIILDEAQNCSVTQMLMVLTRIGENSKMVIAGDPMQHDRGREKSGLTDLIDKFQNYKISEFFHDQTETSELEKIHGIEHIAFSDKDVERHPVIKDILRLYR